MRRDSQPPGRRSRATRYGVAAVVSVAVAVAGLSAVVFSSSPAVAAAPPSNAYQSPGTPLAERRGGDDAVHHVSGA
jgi:hypothetical protein